MNFDDPEFQTLVMDADFSAGVGKRIAFKPGFGTIADAYLLSDLSDYTEDLAQVVCAAAFDRARERQARLEYAPVPAAKPDGVPKLTAEMKAAAEAGTRRYEHFMKLFVDGDFCDPDATSYYEKPRKTRENDKSAGSGDTCAGAKGEGEAMTTPKVCPVWVHPSHDLRALPETGPNADGGARREFQGVSEYYGGCTKCGHGYWSETPNKWLSSECTDRSFPYAADIVSDWEQLSFWPDDKPSMNKNFEEGCLLKVTLSGEYSDHLARTIGPGPVRLVRMEITGLTASVDKQLVFIPWQHIGLVQKEEEK